MKPVVRNFFLAFGVISIIVMLFTFDDGYEHIQEHLRSAGVYLPAVIGVWVFIYLCETRAFQLIVNSGKQVVHMHFRYAFKLSLSGFAFSATTPLGLGGSPYRMMEMAKYVGIPRAMSNVVLYSMMQILSQFLLWTTVVGVLLCTYLDQMNTVLWVVLAVYLVILVGALLVFNYGYHHGLIEKLYCLIVLNIPFVKKPLQRFYDKQKEAMQEIDHHTSCLLRHPRDFWGSLAYEYLARIIQGSEYYLILTAFGLSISYSDALLILAFSSLVGNVLFFLPMQLGAREGGVGAIVSLLGITTVGVGVFAGFYTRIREIFWMIVGVCLVKVGNKGIMKVKE